MKVTIELTEEEAREYLHFKKFKGREAEEIADLAHRLQQLAENTYKALAANEEVSGEIEIVNVSYAKAALHFATQELF